MQAHWRGKSRRGVDQFAQLRQFDGFGHVPVHAGLARALLVLGENVRGQCHHGRASALVADFPGTQLLGGREAIEDRHLAIHQYQVITLGLHGLEGFFAIAGGVRLQVELAQHAADDLGRDAVVFGHQNAEIAGDLDRQRWTQWLLHHGEALVALGQLVGQGCLEGVTGHGFGEDAFDS